MIVAREIRQRFNDVEQSVRFVAEQVRTSVRSFCANNGFVFDDRQKTLDSLAEKIETGRLRSWAEIEDLYACTIAVPLPSDEEKVVAFLQATFSEIRIKRRLAAKKAPDVFRFDSTRFIGKLRMPEGDGEASPTTNILFEAQVKTLFEMAWSKTTHALVYKSSTIDWRSLRLAATLKASVEQMDLLLSGFEHTATLVGEAPWGEINRKKELQTFFKGIADGGLVPTEVWPKDMSRFISNCYDLLCLLEGSEKRHRRDRGLNIFPEAFQKLDTYVSENPGAKFPRSASLFQVVLAILLSQYRIPDDSERWFPITSEMEGLFPALRVIQHRFGFA
jgi:ppGpp synthetase/RelA/SpoT-type nucleotidyltranferase